MKRVIEELLDEVQEFGIDAKHPELEMPCIGNEKVTEHLAKNNVNWIPVKAGQQIYKICPICNPNHNGSCKHCAWSGCFGLCGCEILPVVPPVIPPVVFTPGTGAPTLP